MSSITALWRKIAKIKCRHWANKFFTSYNCKSLCENSVRPPLVTYTVMNCVCLKQLDLLQHICKYLWNINILVDGGWSYWEPWNKCTVTCGGGIRKRWRSCTNPPPRWSYRSCQGNNFESQSCNTNNCPSKKALTSVLK